MKRSSANESVISEPLGEPFYRQWPIYVSFIALIALTLPWWLGLSTPFILMDDPLYVSKNAHVLGGLTTEGILWAFTNTAAAFWLPVTWLSLQFDATLFGSGAAGFHATNIIFHIANTLLLFFILYKATGSHWKSIIVAALFSIHPLRVESVIWITERKDVAGTFFGLLALLFYINNAKTPKISSLASASCFYALSLMAKPLLVTFPFLLLLIDIWPLKRFSRDNIRRLLAEKIPFFLIATGISIATYMIQLQRNALNINVKNPFFLRLENASLSYVLYIRDMFYFGELSAFYPRAPFIPIWQALCCLALLVFLTVLCVYLVRNRFKAGWPIFVGWIWFLGTLVPMIGIIQSGDQSRADRFTYFPSIGLAISFVWGISAIAEYVKIRPTLAVILTLSVLILLAGFTTLRIKEWRDPADMFIHDLSHNEENWYLHSIAGDELRLQNRNDEAIVQLKMGVEQQPLAHEAHNNLGSLLAKNGDLPHAVEQFRIAHELAPENPTYAANFDRATHELQKTLLPKQN